MTKRKNFPRFGLISEFKFHIIFAYWPKKAIVS